MKKLMIVLFVLVMILFLVVPSLLRAQAPITIRGTVTDAETGLPLEGCHVYLNEKMGTVSGEDGGFALIIPSDIESNKVQFSFLGFNMESLYLPELGSQTGDLKILMYPDYIMLEELVFVADPMDDFRDAVNKLARKYGSDKVSLAQAIRKELLEMDLDIVFRPELNYKNKAQNNDDQ